MNAKNDKNTLEKFTVVSNAACALLGTLACTLTLVGCGDGHSGTDMTPDPAPATVPTPTAPTTQTSAMLQGRWSSSDPAYTAILVPSTAGLDAIDTLWLLAQDASTLIKVHINGASQAAASVSGQTYVLGSSAVNQIGNSSYSFQGGAKGAQASLQSVLALPLTISHDDTMSVTLTGTQANGNWQASQGSIKITWNLKDLVLTGSNTAGCTYSGQAATVESMSIYRMRITETCAESSQMFAGISTLNSSASRLTVVASNSSNTRGVAILFTKQP